MRKVILLMVLIGLLLTACSKDKEDTGDAKDKLVDPQTKQDDNTSPLTGLNTDVAADTRPVAVMVNNHPEARPQSGLSKADIVFEVLAEGSITRFLAIFQSEQPEVVGPVRSAREYYFELAEMYDALYVYHGAADFIDEMIKQQGIEHINGAVYDNDGHIFKRESFRKAPHNSYLQFDAVIDIAEQKGYQTTGAVEPLFFLNKEEAEQIDGEPADDLSIAYSASRIVQYEYNEDSESYNRSSDGEPTVELNTEEPIQAENVFIIETPHEVIDDEGRRSIDLTSGGKAYLIRKGKVQEVEWARDEQGIIPIKDGEPVGLVPGKTWVNIIPASPGLEQSVTISGE